MVVGHRVGEDERSTPLALEEGSIEWVSEFPYLGSLIERSHVEVEKRIANASKAFGSSRTVTCQLLPRGVCIEHMCCLCYYMVVSVGYHSGEM